MPTLTIEYQTDAERLALEQAVAYVRGRNRLALTAGHGTVLAACEQLALTGGRQLRGTRRPEVEPHVGRNPPPLGPAPPVVVDDDHQDLLPPWVGVGGERGQPSAIRSTSARGRTTVSDTPVAGRVNPDTRGHSYFARPIGGGTPSHHTRRVIAQVAGPPPQKFSRLVIEADELWSVVGGKRGGVALDADTWQVVGRVAGDRTEATARRLWAALPAEYRAVVPAARYTAAGKEVGLTNHVERFWCTLRPRCTRLVRKTLSFSTSPTTTSEHSGTSSDWITPPDCRATTVQGDPPLRAVPGGVREVTARHRGRSSADDRSRYNSASSRARTSPRANPTWTVTIPWSIFPAHPKYCRCTPGVLSPFLAQLVSSITPTVPRFPPGRPSAPAATRRWSRPRASWSHPAVTGTPGGCGPRSRRPAQSARCSSAAGRRAAPRQ